MEANELRFGNLVCWKDDDTAELTITGILSKEEVYVEWNWPNSGDDGTDCGIDGIAGIPITEEWLVRFGFQKLIPEGSIFELGKFHIQNFSPLGFFECRNHIKVEYVHQLQNLYFALTGEELTIK